MSAALLAALLTAHMIADFILQLDWMAENKHTSTVALAAHTFTHLATAAVLAGAFTGRWGVALAAAVLVAAGHAVVDWSRIHIRWDQTAHLATILAVVAVL